VGWISVEANEFSQVTESFQQHYGLAVETSSNRNEFQELSWG
jgi:hypothetical protein